MTSAVSGSSASTPACRQHGISYSRFIDGLHTAGVEVDRKVLADLAVTDPAAFATLVEKARTAVEQKASEAETSQNDTSETDTSETKQAS